MPVKFDEYEATPDKGGSAIAPDSNTYTILAFLADHPDVGFTPAEIHDETGLPRGSVGTTLRRLAQRGLVRHKEPYWAIDEAGIAAYEAVLTSVQTVEATTPYDWADSDPDRYRIGLNTVREETSDAVDHDDSAGICDSHL